MELRSEDALRQVQERNLNAESQLVAQHAQQIMAQNQMLKQRAQERQAYLQASVGLIHQKVMETADPETGETDMTEGMKRAFPALNALSPEMADQAMTAYSKLAAPEMRMQAQLGSAQTRAQAQLGVAGLKANNPRLDSFSQAMQDYQKALTSGDVDAADLYKSRLQKLSGQLPSAALREGEDLAGAKSKLDAINEQIRGMPEVDPGLEAQRRRYQAIVDSMESRHGQEEIQVATPGGPTVSIVKGGKKQEGALTPGETTRYGEDLQSTSNALRNLNKLRDQLGTGTVGAAPAVENFIFDKVLSQLAPDVVDKNRVAGRQNIRLGTQQVLGELNNRGRFSNQELTAIKEAMPSLGMAESDPNATIKLDELRLMLAEKGAAAAVAIKRPVSDEVLQTLAKLFPPGAEGERALASEVRNGALKPEVALQVRKWQKSKGM